MNNDWKPATEAARIDPLFVEDLSKPLDFVLTPHERSVAASGTLHLEKSRREQNERSA